MISKEKSFPILLLAFIALFFRAAIPVGYMPDPAALTKGHFEITLCSINGIGKSTTSQNDYDPTDKTASHDHESPCSFALSFTWVNLIFAACILSILAFILSGRFFIYQDRRLALSPHYFLPPSQGPPSFS